MTKVRREQWKPRFDVDLVAIPVEDGTDREGVPQIVDVRTPRSPIAKARRVHQLEKRLVDVLIDQPRSRGRDEHARRLPPTCQAISVAQIALESLNSRGVQRDLV